MNQRRLQVRYIEAPGPEEYLALAWEDLVKSNPYSGFMQSLDWARFKAQQGIAGNHAGIFDGENLIGGAIFYFMSTGGEASFLVAPEGPVLPWDDEPLARECLKLLIDYGEGLARQSKSPLIGLRIEPRLPLPVPEMLFEFGRSPMDLIPQETVYLDLRDDLGEILARMKPKGRYNTRLSARKGVSVREGSPGEIIDVFYPLLCQAGRRDNFAVEPLPFFVEIASMLMPCRLATLLLAEVEGEVVGGLLMIVYGPRATYLYGGISNTRRNTMAGYALQWQAVTIAKQAGCTTYDMYGYDRFCSPINRYGRFSRFKSQFGGQAQRFIGAHDYVFMDQLTDKLVQALSKDD